MPRRTIHVRNEDLDIFVELVKNGLWPEMLHRLFENYREKVKNNYNYGAYGENKHKNIDTPKITE